MLPSDPVMLMSVVNTKLRDEYQDLDELCASLGEDKDRLLATLAAAGFEYLPQINQFR